MDVLNQHAVAKWPAAVAQWNQPVAAKLLLATADAEALADAVDF